MYSANRIPDAYSQRLDIVQSPRSLEFAAIAKITNSLRQAGERRKLAFPEFAEALYQNKRLWITLATDVASNENGLTKELRAQIFYLAEFVSSHTSKVLRSEASHDIFIEINTNMMRGLSSNGGV